MTTKLDLTVRPEPFAPARPELRACRAVEGHSVKPVQKFTVRPELVEGCRMEGFDKLSPNGLSVLEGRVNNGQHCSLFNSNSSGIDA